MNGGVNDKTRTLAAGMKLANDVCLFVLEVFGAC
ncbi:hypothetical protein Tph_c02790 [Thermacetogenium phaeum DSM 12270]|uniref:Uncharacterized protein n=1 Tax=Thermacetogenium phaeum (strain ATCC BAA-254 / DSM 26808 / PB) TaxID=1089553 RepID=K4LC67_THEPS|nr:hypothetical protein Tph_c02790 [Thermacetogenium phaeum DSM 12270]